jgi:hypothetical protein
VLEAAVARLPLFCADIAPLRELGRGEATYFEPDAEPAAVARLVLDRLGCDPVFRMAERARQEYAWPRVYTERIEPLLKDAARGGDV